MATTRGEYDTREVEEEEVEEESWLMSPEEAMAIINEKVGGLEVVIDCKSRRVPKKVWATFIDALEAIHIRVKFIASFNIEEIRGISVLTKVGG